jgi:hypothetical protein
MHETPPPMGQGGCPAYPPLPGRNLREKERVVRLPECGFTSGIGGVRGTVAVTAWEGGYPAYPPPFGFLKCRVPLLQVFHEL